MIELRPFGALGHADHGWLDARHHFSFASYHDAARMGWGAIRVWNDDRIAPRSGFPMHPHNDMEIITYVRSGAISHRDNMGNSGRTAAGDVQIMSAGTAITHSEFNLESEETTLFQIWILPDVAGGVPHWGQRAFPREDRANRWLVLASGAGDGGDALPLRADAQVLGAFLGAGASIDYVARPERHLYLVATKGSIVVNGIEASAQDGLAITNEPRIAIEARADSEIILVDAL